MPDEFTMKNLDKTVRKIDHGIWLITRPHFFEKSYGSLEHFMDKIYEVRFDADELESFIQVMQMGYYKEYADGKEMGYSLHFDPTYGDNTSKINFQENINTDIGIVYLDTKETLETLMQFLSDQLMDRSIQLEDVKKAINCG